MSRAKASRQNEPAARKRKAIKAELVPVTPATGAPDTSIKNVVEAQRSRWIKFLAQQIALDILRTTEIETE